MAVKLGAGLLALALVSGCASAPKPVLGRAAVKRLAPGAKLPEAERAMKNVDGAQVRIADVRGPKGTLVVVTCNHCPWSKAWEGRIAALGRDYADRGVGTIALNPNDPAVHPTDSFVHMQERAAELQLAFPYVVDAGGVVTRALGASKTPEVFLFDAEDTLVYVGAVDDEPKDPAGVGRRYLQDALDALVTGAEVPLAETRALGCSIAFGG